MNSFREKLKNLITTSLTHNHNLNLEQNLNQTILDTQRRIRKDKNFIYTERTIQGEKNNKNILENKFDHYSLNNESKSNKKIKISTSKNNEKRNSVYRKINIENLYLNENNQIVFNYKEDKYDINKKYKNLYNKSCMNLNKNKYNKNKAYLNYKIISKNNLFNNYNKNKFNKINYSNIYNNNRKNNILSHRCSSLTSKNKFQKNNYFNNQKSKYENNENNFENIKNSDYLEIYDNFINDNNKKDNDAFIIKNKKRISNSIKKKINLLIGENDLKKISNNHNIVNKLPRPLTSDLYKIDHKYYNDISPVTKFLNKEKRNIIIKANNKKYNKNISEILFNYNLSKEVNDNYVCKSYFNC